MAFVKFRALFYLIFLVASQAFGASYQLFSEPGVRARGYSGILQNLQPNDQIVFSNERRFTVYRVLGEGGNTLVLDIGDGKALRLNTRPSNYKQFSLSWYVEGYSKLKDSGIPIVKVFLEESLPSEYLVVEKIPVEFTLDQVLVEGFQSPYKTETLYEALLDFAMTTERYAGIGDLKPAQIGWDGKKWILLDWGKTVVQKKWYLEGFAFLDMKYFEKLPEEFRVLVHSRLVALRRERCISNLRFWKWNGKGGHGMNEYREKSREQPRVILESPRLTSN